MRDERGDERALGKQVHRAHPHGLASLHGEVDEIPRRAALRIDARRIVFVGPAAIVFAGGVEEHRPRLAIRQSISLPVRQQVGGHRRVVGLPDQEPAVAVGTHDHRGRVEQKCRECRMPRMSKGKACL